MDLDLQNKWALATGSSAGIGAAVVKALAREGAHIIVHGRDAERTDAVAKAIRDSGTLVASVTGDLATNSGANAVLDLAMTASGRIDILIDNAGSYAARPWLETTPDTAGRRRLGSIDQLRGENS